MELKKIIVSLVLLFSLLGLPTKDSAEELSINPLDLTTSGQVAYFSHLYGGNEKVINKVIECESGGNHQTVSDGGRSNGILQFQKETFKRMSKAFGEKLNYNSKFDQVKLGSWALSHPELAQEWTTYVAIQKGGKYAFYSKQLKRHFTIYCKV